MTSPSELGNVGQDSVGLLADGTLDSATIDHVLSSPEITELGILFLPGLYSSSQQEFKATQAIIPDIEETVLNRTRGVVLNRSWFAGNDQYLFCREPLDSPQDFADKKVRSHNPALADWIDGMDAYAEFWSFDFVPQAMQNRRFDCAMTGVIHANERRWNELADYMVGPLVSFPFATNVINWRVWASIPGDLQDILIEEAAKSELEALRLASIQNEVGLTGLQEAGTELVPFSEAVSSKSFNTAVVDWVLPRWIDKVGDTNNPIIADTFNLKIGPIVGLHVKSDGTILNARAPSTPTATPLPTPTATQRPTPPPPPRPQPSVAPGEQLTLNEYADRFEGGPGAIYVDDLAQLEGRAVTSDFLSDHGAALGDDFGNVPLIAIEEHHWLFESDYYRSLLEKAKLTNPTELVSTGEKITLQHACVHSSLNACRHLESWFVPNVSARTKGQVQISVSSYPELGISGLGVPDYLRDGVLDMAEIYGSSVSDRYALMSLQHLWGLWPDSRTHFEVTTRLAPAMQHLLMEDTGSPVLMRTWTAGEDQFLFSNQKLESRRDFRNLRTRSFSAQISAWLDGMGASPQFAAYAEVYVVLDREIFDAAFASARAAREQRWYEVTDYMNGPLINFDSSVIAINRDIWDRIPRDLQQILIEEAAKHELESLRLAAVQNVVQKQRAVDAGLEPVEFDSTIRQLGFQSAYEYVLPHWIIGIYGSVPDEAEIATFNKMVGPLVGLRIEPNGNIAVVPITEGPHAGKTMEQVLAE